ncbi:nuclear body protein SP140-like isoform X2 [Myxocyprinus asiaticus]|uniref:nuclear body protein SP140-like isoform X2 n=1 Tax=Myxocyprinus asiaticus TaxID=70543 RepID=UPI002222AEC6|nr:nuclear body protein SP140-like isoform X2 [Myxocyprinus asiaticus]
MDKQSDTDSNSESGSEWEAESMESSFGSDWLGENCKRKKAQRGQKRKMKTQSCKETGPSSFCTTNKKRQTKDSSQSVGQTIKDKSQLPVTCGDKEGVLYLDKFDNAEKCILSEEQWFKPTEFEKFGGKGRNKKWKSSILYNGIPIQKLIEGRSLLSPTFRKSRVQDGQSNSPESSVVTGRLRRRECRTELFPSNRSDDESSDERDKVHYEDDSNSDDDDDDNDVDDDDDDDDVTDMTMFEGPTLPVKCGSNSGILHKYRFASGHCGKCIRTEDLWLTPEDFIRLKKPEGTWRKDIVSHEVPLGQLIMKRVLILHIINCDCDICENLDQYANDDVCYMCNSEEDLVCCDECPRAFHPDCHLPTVDDNSPGSQWSCTFCVMKNMEVSSQKTQQDFLSSPISHYRLYCQYLLLYLLHESTTDPFTDVPGFSEDISGPLMLGRAKLKLKNNDYQTVGDFVTDIEDVFQHCISNRDNDFCRMTHRLKELFTREFKSIFKIL